MRLDIYQVDAFADKVFEGNPAAICPLEKWLDDKTMQQIAEENNLAETAFTVPNKNGFDLRWFTPVEEVDLCGHATLAAAHVLYKHLAYSGSKIVFNTRSGDLIVKQVEQGLSMDFPASMPQPVKVPDGLLEALGIDSAEALAAFDYIVVLESESAVKAVTPDFSQLTGLDLRGVVVTAIGNDVDFVSRCFYPKLRINEDAVTGSAHCELAPYWGGRLGLDKMTAKQLSRRSGLLGCELLGDRVVLYGNSADYLKGQIIIPS